MIRTGLRGWLVVRQGLTRRIYGAADAGLFISRSLRPASPFARRFRDSRKRCESGKKVRSRRALRNFSDEFPRIITTHEVSTHEMHMAEL